MRGSFALLICLLLTVFAMMSCGGGGAVSSSSGTTTTGGNPGGGATTTQDYFPMTVNSVWNYNVTAGSTSYQSTNLVTQVTTSAVFIKSSTTLNSIYSIVEYSKQSSGAWTFSKITTYNSNGSVSQVVTFSPPLQITPSNWATGTHETVNSTESVSNGSHYSYTQDITVNGSESVTVPSGTFNNAMKVTNVSTIQGTTNTTTYWFVDGEGLVKSSATNYSSPLSSYTIH